MTSVREARGPLAVLGATLAGIGAAHGVPPSPATSGLVLAVGCGAAAAASHRRGRGLLALVAVGLLAAGLTARARHGLAVTPLDAAVERGELVSLTGTLVGDPAARRWETSVEVRVHRFRPAGGTVDHAGGGRHVVAAAPRPSSSRLAVLQAGDRVVVTGRFEPLRPFDASRRDRHLVAGLRVSALDRTDGARSPLMRTANRTRAVVLRGIEHVPPAHRALVAGFLLGDTRGLSPELEDGFRRAGLSHLLVVSGSNVAFVLALAAPLRRRLGLRGRLAVGLAVVVVFAAATRFEPSVLRASVMAALSMIAAFAGRPSSGLRLLVLAATGLLLVDPLLVHSIAFRLSCGASAGILLCSRPLARRIPGPDLVREPLATTTAAQVGVAPVLTALPGGLPLVALPANLAAAWAAGPLTVWGMVAAVSSWGVERVSPEVAALFHVPTTVLAAYLEGVAGMAGRFPLAVGRPALAVAAAGVLGLVVARGRPSSLHGDGSHPPARPVRP